MRPPFRVNIAGVVVDVGMTQPSVGGTGKSVRTIVLQDPTGAQVSIRQLGSGAEETDIQPRHRIVVFFVTGKGEYRSGEPGSLWAYEDSYIKMGEFALLPPVETRDIPIRG